MRMIIINRTYGVSAKPCRVSDEMYIVSLFFDLFESKISQIQTASDLSFLRRSKQICPCDTTKKNMAEFGANPLYFRTNNSECYFAQPKYTGLFVQQQTHLFDSSIATRPRDHPNFGHDS